MPQLVKVRKVRILGTGSYVPERVLSNLELEKIVDTSDEWVRENLGIVERRIAAPGQSTSTLAIEAGMKALENSGVKAMDIDMILVATATPDRIAPATATKVQAAIGASKAAAFDINAVCAGFIYGLTVGAQFVGTGASHNVLVIGADTFSRITDWTRRDCVFFGDGAGAAVVSASDDDSGFMCMKLFADGRGFESFTVPAGGSEIPASLNSVTAGLHYFRMNGRTVYNTAVEVIPAALRNVLDESGLTVEAIDHVVPHQPSIRILEESARRIGIPFSKFGTNMDRYANTSSATIPILLDEMWRSGKIKRGDLIALVAVGAGWTWGAALLRW
ncbi:MAG: beta-ketoacyl-ACP synthase III [Candidatus Fermentibacteraceae bacterium]